MYTPKIFSITEQSKAVDFMQRFNFATIISSKDSAPVATHLPFLINHQTDGSIVLQSHMAKANTQWQDLEDQQILVIFNEPHAYISPKHYETELNVPTWNYIALHAYGTGKCITAHEELNVLMKETIQQFDADYQTQWNRLPSDYKSRMLNGIIGFEITVTELQYKQKLSQNKSAEEQSKIADSLSESKLSHEQQISEYMKAD